MSIPAGTWVEIEQTLLTPEQRTANLPADTASTPYLMRVSGFLTEDADLGAPARVTTQAGRTLEGVLRVVEPHYEHSFGPVVPELLRVRIGGDHD